MNKHISGCILSDSPHNILISPFLFTIFPFKYFIVHTHIDIFSRSGLGLYIILLYIIDMFASYNILLNISLNIILHLSIILSRIPRYLKYDTNVATINHIIRVIIFSIYLNIDMVK